MDKEIISHKVIGILGGGQLGKMLCIAAQRLGYAVHIYSESKENPAVTIADYHTIGTFNEFDKIDNFSKSCSIVTFETENIPKTTLNRVALLTAIAPNFKSLEITQDRLKEKKFLNSQKISTANFFEILSLSNIETGSKKIQFPAIIKTNRFGYDGKGQYLVRNIDELIIAWEKLEKKECILEEQINFQKELSIVLARKNNHSIEIYEPSINFHENGILITSDVSSTPDKKITLEARRIATKIANNLGHVGVICIEMFLTETNKLLVNEIAPRVHNSGHWTLDGAVTDQFEQHIRSICDLPLGKPNKHSSIIMKNILGDEILDIRNKLSDPFAKIYIYGKKNVKKNRKMGHVNFIKHATH